MKKKSNTKMGLTIEKSAHKIWKKEMEKRQKKNKWNKGLGQLVAELALEIDEETIIERERRKQISIGINKETKKQLQEKAKKIGTSVSHLFEVALWEMDDE